MQLRDYPGQPLQVMAYVATILIITTSWLLTGVGHQGYNIWLTGNCAYIIITGGCLYWYRTKLASGLLVGWYIVIGSLLLSVWTIDLAVGVLLLVMAIGIAGILFGSRSVIPVTLLVIVALVDVHLGTRTGLLHPSSRGVTDRADVLGVITYSLLFVAFAVLTWLARWRTERALRRAQLAERELATQLQTAHHSLDDTQLAEVRHLYRLSTLGDMSVAALHEIANQLTVTILDAENIPSLSPEVRQLKRDILQLEAIVMATRHRINRATKPQRIEVNAIVRETVVRFNQRYKRKRVHVSGLAKSLYIRGDPLLLSQVVYTLIANALDASSARRSWVEVTLSQQAQKVNISVTNAECLTAEQRSMLFQPITSTKPKGIGIGLFIAKQLTEVHLHGNLQLSPRYDQTTFIILLPKAKAYN